MKLKIGIVCSLLAIGSGCSETDPKLEPRLLQKPVEKVADNKAVSIGSRPVVDILFVIDDSKSMNPHQTNLITNLDRFLDKFFESKLIDFHIGVISSSLQSDCQMTGQYCQYVDGRLAGRPAFVDRNTPNGLAVLKTNLRLGINGTGNEKFFEPTRLALTEPNLSTYNRGFYRPDAHLALVMITDANDTSYSYSAQSFYNFLVKDLKKGRTDKLIAYTALVESTDVKACGLPDYGLPENDWPPVKIEEFIRLAKGTSFSLCDPAFGQKLASIGQDLFGRVTSAIKLNRAPMVDTIRVSYGTQVIPQDSRVGWSYEASTVSLIFGPEMKWSETQPAGTKVQIDFTAVDFDLIQ